jgi:hypothetical protein
MVMNTGRAGMACPVPWQAEREQAREEMWAKQTEMTRRMHEEDESRREQNKSSASGSAGSSTAIAVGWALGRFFATPLIPLGNGPALLTRGIFISLPLAVAVLYYFRSVSPWITITLVALILIFASPLLVSILRAILRIVLILAVVLVVIAIAGFIFHWWH